MKFLLSLLTLCPASLFAVDAHNHQPQAVVTNQIDSYKIVSPAQIRHSDSVVTDIVYNIRRTHYKNSDPANEIKKFMWNDNVLTATAIYSVPGTSFNVGVAITNSVGSRHSYSLHLGSFDVEGRAKPDLQSSHTKYWRISELTISPMANYWLNDMIAIGIRLNNHGVHRDYAIDGLDTDGVPYYGSENLTTVMPAVSLVSDTVEVGVAYLFDIAPIVGGYDKDYYRERHPNYDFEQPNYLLVHGRYALTPTMKIGGSYRFEQHSILRQDRADRSVISLNSDWQLDRVSIEGEVTHATSFYDNRREIAVSNIATTAARTAVDYRLQNNASLGAGIGYRYGADEEAEIKYRVSELDLAVRANYLF